jgi:hypothetical protein
VTSSLQEPTKSQLVRTNDTPITQGITRVLGTVSGTEGRDQIYIFMLQHAMEYYSALKRKEILSHATIWMNLQDIR